MACGPATLTWCHTICTYTDISREIERGREGERVRVRVTERERDDREREGGRAREGERDI